MRCNLNDQHVLMVHILGYFDLHLWIDWNRRVVIVTALSSLEALNAHSNARVVTLTACFFSILIIQLDFAIMRSIYIILRLHLSSTCKRFHVTGNHKRTCKSSHAAVHCFLMSYDVRYGLLCAHARMIKDWIFKMMWFNITRFCTWQDGILSVNNGRMLK